MKKISIVLPVYNVEDYLDQCLQSILNQTYSQFELIIINDGSTDSGGVICEKYAKEDSRIKLINQENMGLSMARNNGLEVAIGEYIMFVDSDDSIHKDMLKVTYQNLIDQQADVSICDHQLVYEDEEYEQYADSVYENNIQVLDNLEAVNEIVEKSHTNMIIAWGKLYKKSLFEEVKYPRGKYHEDEFVTYKLLYDSNKVVVTDAKLYFYLQRTESITGDTYSLKRLEKLEGLKEATHFFEEKNETELAVKARARYLLNIQIGYYRVKYEMANEQKVLKVLKNEYETQYKQLRNATGKLPIFQATTLRAFYASPNLYSFMVRIFSKSGWSF